MKRKSPKKKRKSSINRISTTKNDNLDVDELVLKIGI
jgi:hypothetical protein